MILLLMLCQLTWSDSGSAFKELATGLKRRIGDGFKMERSQGKVIRLGRNFMWSTMQRIELSTRSGKRNRAADALSRCHDGSGQHMAITGLVFQYLDQLRAYYRDDIHGRNMVQKAQTEGGASLGITLQDGLLLNQGRIVVPENHPLQEVREFHSTVMGGHAGLPKTLKRKRLAAHFYWPKMRDSVTHFVNACIVCPQSATTKPGGLLEPLPIPENIWQDISMDLPTCQTLMGNQGHC